MHNCKYQECVFCSSKTVRIYSLLLLYQAITIVQDVKIEHYCTLGMPGVIV